MSVECHSNCSIRLPFFSACLAALLPLATRSEQAWAQGAAVITPLSKSVFESSSIVPFYIHNRLSRDIALKYEVFCEVDGAEKRGEECLQVFDVNLGSHLKGDLLQIATGGRVEASVSLKKKDVRYALFKPLFSPTAETENAGGEGGGSQGVQFQFRYQPGYLFILKPADERLKRVHFDTYTFNNAKRARFKIELVDLSMPQELSISAKILDKANKKLLRFVPLAKEKIADPRRGSLELEGDFAASELSSEVCYQLLVENKARKDFYKVSDCP